MELSKLPLFPEQIDLQFSHRSLVSEALAQQGVLSADFAFYNLLGWYNSRLPKISRAAGRIIIDVEGPDETHFFMAPFGWGPMKDPLRILLENLSHFDTPPVLHYVPGPLAQEIQTCVNVTKIVAHRQYFDYIYDRHDLANLPGRKFQRRRNQVNRIQTEGPPTVEMLGPGNVDETLTCLAHWYEAFGQDDPVLAIEARAAQRMFPYLTELGAIGIVLRQDGEIVGTSVATPILPHCWMVPIEKANREIKGLYQFVNWALANRLPPEVTLVNRETDLGLAGLRESKMRYYPVRFEEKFSLWL